ncbi:MAG: hypothetical protein EOP83_20995, partial [Verrucomicrobiaceae bacterium]
MKLHLFTAFSLLSLKFCVASEANYALSFNGIDEQVDLFMAPLMKEWTVSAWIKKEGPWKEKEVVVGNGWVTTDGWEDYPLCVDTGRLAVGRTGVFAKDAPAAGIWHHIASIWDGETTTLYWNGEEIAKKRGGGAICPSFLGSGDGKEFFKGQIDEVRVWNTALPKDVIESWMGKPVDSSHPRYNRLVAYYRFDDQALDATDYAGENKADRKIHYKSKRSSEGPAYVINDNAAFAIPAKPMTHLASHALRSTLGARPGERDVELLKLRIHLEGNQTPLHLNGLTLDLSKCDALDDIERLHIDSLGPDAELDRKLATFEPSIAPAAQLRLEQGDSLALKPGINYIAVTADLRSDATPGHHVHARCEALSLSGQKIEPLDIGAQAGKPILSPKKDPHTVKVLNWNIWHGGIEKGREIGPQQMIEVIKASDADVVAMVETYGSGPRIAQALGYRFHETGPGSNLSIMSRYPIVDTYKSNKGSFSSTGVKVKLDNGKEALIWCVWLRYWKGDYTIAHNVRNYESKDQWIAGDNNAPVVDLQEILEKDIDAFYDGKMPIVIAGDFNSCSHLDFTMRAAAAGIHNGWEVDFPTAKVILNRGYKD